MAIRRSLATWVKTFLNGPVPALSTQRLKAAQKWWQHFSKNREWKQNIIMLVEKMVPGKVLSRSSWLISIRLFVLLMRSAWVLTSQMYVSLSITIFLHLLSTIIKRWAGQDVMGKILSVFSSTILLT